MLRTLSITQSVQTGPASYPDPYTMGTVSCPEVEQQWHGIDHPLPSSAEVKERVELKLYSRVNFTFTFTLAYGCISRLRKLGLFSFSGRKEGEEL
jgi:hypothetical protein